jgi:DNA-binding CsgD family transcriptional regulator
VLGARLEAPQPVNLLERDGPLSAIERTLDGARHGQGGTLFVVGEPGLGKTALLAECSARAAGFSIGRVACTELEQSVPFGLLGRLLGGLGGPEGALAAGGYGSAEARLHRYSSILEWLRRRAPVPLLLALDDLHWSDTDSVVLLSLVCRRLEALAVAVVATCRPWPAGALEQARSLVADGYAALERLEPLSREASSALLEERLGAGLPPEFVEQASDACAGNPLLLGEVAGARLRGEEVILEGSAGKLGERVFLPRFAGVGVPGLRWARTASVLGTRFRPELVHRLSGQSAHDAAGAMDALMAAGLVRSLPGGEAEFVHPQFRQALYEDLSIGVRQGLHAGVLRELLEEGAPAAEAVPHALGAQLKGDPKAIGVLASAGREALVTGAPATAIEHLQAALELAGPRAEPGLYFDLAEACLVAGNVPVAEKALAQLLGREDLRHPDRVAGVRVQARVLLASGRYPEAKRCFEAASELALAASGELAAEILLDGAFVGHHFEGPRESRRTVQRALDMLEGPARASDTLRLAAASAEANLACINGDPSRLDEVAAAAKSNLALGGVRAAWGWDIVFAYALLAKAFERFEDCQLVFASLMEEAKRRGAELTYQTLAINHADVLWRLGQLDEANRLVARAAEAADLAPGLAPFAWVGLAHTCHEQGSGAEGALWASRVEAAIGPMGGSPYLRLWLCMLCCREKLRSGELAAAVEYAEQAALVAKTFGIIEPCIVPWQGAAIEAHVSSGQLEKAAELVSSLDEICRLLPCRAPRAVAACGGALVAWRSGDLSRAEAGFNEALCHNRAVPMPLAEAETLIAYGRFLRHGGQMARARRVLHDALSVLEGTGAGRLQGIAQEQLALAGGRRSRSAPARELTAMELQVTKLAARGLTNSQIAGMLFLSAKTVEHHLSHAYANLGVASRRDLIMALQGEGPAAYQAYK